jgi:hypothetical protein
VAPQPQKDQFTHEIKFRRKIKLKLSVIKEDFEGEFDSQSS